MNYLKQILIITALISSRFMVAQDIRVEGVVLNSDDNKAIPHITVFTQNREMGTATNQAGHFSLLVPKSFVDSYIYFTAIGFKKDSLLIKECMDMNTITLSPETYVLQEVLIMPDSTLLTLMRSAFNRIDRNYPAQPSAYSGFYRESVQDESDAQVDFTETILHIYKDAYTRPTGLPGQIEIIKSRKRNFQNTGRRYIGGPFLTIEMDDVLKRKKHINPRYFKDYEYVFNGVVSKDEMSFYSISWKKKGSERDINQSTMFIEQESLAYVEFLNEGIEGVSQPNLKDITIDRRTIYEKAGSYWVLKYLTYKNTHTDRISSKVRTGVVEYVTNSVEYGKVDPIPFEKRLGLTDAISYSSDDYSTSNWIDYVQIEKDGKLNYIFTFSQDESVSIFQSPTTGKEKLRSVYAKLISNLNIEFGVSYRQIDMLPNVVTFSFAPSQNIASFDLYKTDKFTGDCVFFESLAGYRVSKSVNIYYSGISDFGNKNMKSNLRSVGVEYRRNIKQSGYPLFLQGGVSISNMGYYVDMGTHENSTPFTYRGKNFDANKLKFEYGTEIWAITPEIAIKNDINRLLGLKLFVKYHIPVSTKENLRMKESSGFFMTRKTAKIDKSDNAIQDYESKEPWESLTINNFSVGLSFTFN